MSNSSNNNPAADDNEILSGASGGSIIGTIQKIAAREIRKVHLMELGVVTSVFPHSEDSDNENYECNVKLKDRGDMELRKVPVLSQHIGLSNIPHVNDLVLVSFINGDINAPIIIGRLYNDEDRPPVSKQEEIIYKPPYQKNAELKRINITLPEDTVKIDIHDNKIEVQTGKAKISMEDTGIISIEAKPDDKECKLTLDSNGVKIDTAMKVEVKSKDNISFNTEGELLLKARSISIESEADTLVKAQTIGLESKGDMKLKAVGANIESSAPMSIKSNATATIEATGPMTIKTSAIMTVQGALVKLN